MRALFAAAFAVAVLLVAPQGASGHAAFVGASPDPGQRTERTPGSVTLRFTEPLNPALTSVGLSAVSSGDEVAGKLAIRRGSTVVVDTGKLATGAYRVEWRTVSTRDGHALTGTFSFGVRTAALGEAQSVEQSPFADRGEARVVTRFLLYTVGLLFAAAVLLPRLLGREWLVPPALGASAEMSAVRARADTLVGSWGGAAVAAAVAAVVADAGSAARSLRPAALSDYLLTNSAGLARLAVVACFAVAAIAWRRWPRIAAIAALLALGAVAASGHASSASPRVPTILTDWLHLVSAAAWVGGIGLLALVWARPLRRGPSELRGQVAKEVLRRFGRIAGPAFVAVTLTGLVGLITQLGHVSALWETDYGLVLTVKIGLVAALAAASWMHALRLRPRLLGDGAPETKAKTERRHWRLVRGEPYLGLGVVVLVAVLVAFPLPPRQLGHAEEARAAAPPCAPCPLPKPRQGELPVAAQAGSHIVAGWIRRSGGVVNATIRIIDIRGKPAPAPLRVAGADVSACGTGCWRLRHPGADVLRVRVMEKGRWYPASLPATWDANATLGARRMLRRAEEAMRDLSSVRQIEEVSSGPGSYARTEFELQAPDRMELRTDRGVRRIIIGGRQWSKFDASPWRAERYGSGLEYRTRSAFSWRVHARTIRLLGRERVTGRSVVTLAFFEEGTPVWFQLRIDEASGRVLREEMITRGHFMRTRYVGFGKPVSIVKPRLGRG